jgi:hypothetical protein
LGGCRRVWLEVPVFLGCSVRFSPTVASSRRRCLVVVGVPKLAGATMVRRFDLCLGGGVVKMWFPTILRGGGGGSVRRSPCNLGGGGGGAWWLSVVVVCSV